MRIFSTDYVWNWLVTLNSFLDGLAWGCGLAVALLVLVLLVNKAGKKEKSTKEPA